MDNRDLLHKIVACLERIAFNTQGGPLEFEAYLKEVLYKEAAILALEELKHAVTGSEVQVQEGNKDKVSYSKRRGRRSKKHEDGGDTHPTGISAGQEEEIEIYNEKVNRALD
jgi:hypothetical protein